MNDFRQDSKLTILYQRLSKDDEQSGESNSILNQRRLLEEYAESNGLIPYLSISDDGYSGTNFQRPGWTELISKVEAGEVSTILVKTMDRIGRDYLRVGLFREMIKECGVRILSVTEGYDSESGDDDLSPFREIMAEFYARDTSRKIKSVLSAKGRDGKPLGTLPIYGFKKDPDNANARLIDDESAEVVRRIFQMTIDGKGPHQIAKTLMEEKVERPSYYMYRAGIVATSGKCDLDLPYNWRGNTVSVILKHREYMGDVVNFKTVKPSYKSKKQVKNDPDKMLVFENALPAIVDRETWELAQKCRRTVRRVPGGRHEPNPLTGLLFCADCGAKLHNRQSHYTEDKDGNRVHPVDTYECTNYRKNADKFVDACSIHFIRTSVVRELALDTIRKTSSYVRENEAEFIEKLREATTVRQIDMAKTHKRQLAKNDKRIAELDMLFIKVYEDNATGKLTDERFAQMSAAYDKEQADLKAQNETLRAELEAFEQDNLKADNFIGLVRRYTEFDELTTPMLHEFVDRILVHEADKSSGERRQTVDIYLNYIGKFAIPGDEAKPLTPEEQAAEEERLEKKRKKNEYLREWRKKKKDERIAAEANLMKTA
jgi:DNA invertase Pin-like site-specific DNA recombinase